MDVEKRIVELLRVPGVGSQLKDSKSSDEAARLLLQLSGDKARGLDVAVVASVFERSESQGISELSDEDLSAVSGGMMPSANDPNTGGHTQCCYHCFGK